MAAREAAMKSSQQSAPAPPWARINDPKAIAATQAESERRRKRATSVSAILGSDDDELLGGA